jgi:hypothetical protein
MALKKGADGGEMQWEAFRRNPPTAICYRHVPWLPGVEPPGEGVDWERASLVEALGVDLKEQQLAWHPDKFTQHFGDQLYAADAQRIMTRWDVGLVLASEGAHAPPPACVITS